MTDVDSFDKLQEKVRKMEEDKEQLKLDQESIREAKSDARQQLRDLQQQRAEIYKRESELKKDVEDQTKRYEVLEKTKRTQENAYNSLVKQFQASKSNRNKKLVSWWMDEYGNFDDMNLSQLKDWLANAVLSQRHGDRNSGGNSESDQLYKSHLQKLAKVNSDDDAQKQARHDHEVEDDQLDREGKSTKKDQNKTESQKLADKQRIYSNRQKNNPIDTKAEVEDDEQAESPFGTEDIDKELQDYADSSSSNDVNRKLTKDEVAKKFKSEFEL